MSLAQTRTDFACCAAFAPTGNFIASGSIDGDVCIWNTSTKKIYFETQAFLDIILCIAFSLDGTLLLGCSTAYILCWNTKTWQLQLQRTIGCKVICTAFAPNGTTFVTGEGDGAVSLRSLATGSICAMLHEDDSPITSVMFSPNGEILVAGSANGTIRVASTLGGMHRLCSRTSLVNGVAFAFDGRMLASAFGDGAVCVWDFPDVEINAARVFPSLCKSLQGVVFSSTGSMLAAFSQDGIIFICKNANGQSSRSVRVLQNAGRVLCVKFAHHDNALLFCTQYGISNKCQFVLDHETMRALAPCFDVGVASYVLLDIVNFLLANANKIRLVDEENFFHGKKIAFISQRQKVKR
jgi:WD40 repeat protein